MSSMTLPGQARVWTRMDHLHAAWRRRFHLNAALVASLVLSGWVVAVNQLPTILGGGW